MLYSILDRALRIKSAAEKEVLWDSRMAILNKTDNIKMIHLKLVRKLIHNEKT